MNKVIYVEVFTTMVIDNNATYVRIRRDSGYSRHETYKINTIRRADQINKLLRESFDISGATVGPWGILSIVWHPKLTSNKILKDLGHTSSTITPRYVPPTESADYVICPNCEKKNFFTAWVYAHWDMAIRLTCECEKNLIIKQGELFK